MKGALFVGIGGFFGSLARYGVGVCVARVFGVQPFPFATLIVNLIGCLLIGLLGEMATRRLLITPDLELLLMVGLLGGFTTFSAFGYQTIALLREEQIGLAMLNVAAHIIFGLAAVWVGVMIGRHI